MRSRVKFRQELSIRVSGRKTRLFGEDLFDLGNPIVLRLVVASGELFGLLVALPSQFTPMARFCFSSAFTHLRLHENDRRERRSVPIQGLNRYRVEGKHTTTPGRKQRRIEKSVQPTGCSGLTTSGRTPAFLDHLFETPLSENVAILRVQKSRARDRGLFDRADRPAKIARHRPWFDHFDTSAYRRSTTCASGPTSTFPVRLVVLGRLPRPRTHFFRYRPSKTSSFLSPSSSFTSSEAPIR